MWEFLFPEIQIIESIKKYGFIRKLPSTQNSPVQYNAPTKNSLPNTKPSSYQSNTSVQDSDGLIGQMKNKELLVKAFKRPIIKGLDKSEFQNAIFISGPLGTGRDMLLDYVFNKLNIEKKSLIMHTIDLAKYNFESDFERFLVDLLPMLTTQSNTIRFLNIEQSSALIRGVLEEFALTNYYKLNGMYGITEDQELVKQDNIPLAQRVEKLSVNGRYFIFMCSGEQKTIRSLFSDEFNDKVKDFIVMEEYTEKERKEITNTFLDAFNQKTMKQLGYQFGYTEDFINWFSLKYSPSIGFDVVNYFLMEEVFDKLGDMKFDNILKHQEYLKLDFSDQKILLSRMDDTTMSPIDLSSKLDLSLLDVKNNDKAIEEVKVELDRIVGLESVKKYILSLEQNLYVQKRRESAGFKAGTISKHMIFTGNPGTGKTTIARLLAKYLKEIKVLNKGQLIEVTRGDLVGQYVGETAQKTAQIVNSALGGVLFIDEAYALCRDKHDVFGLEAVDTIVKAMEDHRDNLIVVLAGYQKEMGDFLEVNSGLKSRFPNIVDFIDYTPEEMLKISKIIANGKGYRIDDLTLQPLLELFEQRQIPGKNDSGNGRLVRNIIEAAILEQSKRLYQNMKAEMDLLLFEDFKLKITKGFNIEEALANVVGLNNVKEMIKTQYNFLLAAKRRKEQGIKVDTTQSLNMIFSGNPGTGKTTIARITAHIFKEIGVLKQGQLIEVDRTDLISEYVGQTAQKTTDIFLKALGGVLFIDEAYSLGNDSVGKECIDTLVKLTEDHKDNIVVILAGYTKEMKDFLKTNSGLESRFPLDIEFLDYSVEELYDIALLMIRGKGFTIDEETILVLKKAISQKHKTSNANSGNARMIRNMLEEIIRTQSARIVTSEETTDLIKIIATDIIGLEPIKENSFDLEKIFTKVIGLDEVKRYMRSLYARLKIHLARKEQGLHSDTTQSLHMIFKGNPGTGKTMMARTAADILYNIGIISSNKLVETDRAGLVAGYVGQTAMKTQEKVMEAMDGVLFIDEAYSLAQGGANDFGREAIDTLVKMMDDHRDRLVVILAGYDQNMDEFLQTNPGLHSRFPNIIEFADYSVDELLQIADLVYSSKHYSLNEDAKIKLTSILEKAVQKEMFGNGRYIRNIFERSVNNQAYRLSQGSDLSSEALVNVIAEDIEEV